MSKENKSLFALLGVLSLRPHTGYEIKKTIEEGLNHFWRIGYGQIYPNLRKLVELGWAVVRMEEQQGKPDKNIYTITETGMENLHQWLRRPIEDIPVEKNELLLKLFFGDNIPIDESITHISKFKNEKKETLADYQAIERFLTSEDCKDKNKIYALLTLRYGKRVTESIIDWCEESLSTLKKLKE